MRFWGRPSEPEQSPAASTSGAALGAPAGTPAPPPAAASSPAASLPASPPAADVWVPQPLTAEEEFERRKAAAIQMPAVPTQLLVVPTAAGLVGLFIGMRRGATAARLRFLAENAHRQPTTVQGWYFYLKTRNYRMLAGGMKSAAGMALRLGSVTALFVAMDEGAGFLRERLDGSKEPFRAAPTSVNPDRKGWRKGPVHVGDGAVAGSTLGMIVGLAYRLPNPVLIRAVIMGTGAGLLWSCGGIATDHLAALRREQDAAKAADAAAHEQAEREARVAQGLSPEPEPTPDELKKPEDRNIFEKIGAWARGRDKERDVESKAA